MTVTDTLLETPSRIGPCLLESARGPPLDLLPELSAAASTLFARLRPKTAANLADLVRVMNCYYSNLIEGHDTRPRDVERALANDFDRDGRRRNLRLEAKQHIRLQRALDAEFAGGILPDPTSVEFVRRLHREFYQDVPELMLRIEGEGRSFVMTPGEFCSRPEHDGAGGRHAPPSSVVVETFMRYFESRYALTDLGPAARIMALAAAHHSRPCSPAPMLTYRESGLRLARAALGRA